MKFVLTNDDGIDAPGLATLLACIRPWGPCVVAAPAEAQSGVGHRVTTRDPIQVDSISPGRFRVHGTPVDCVRIALTHLAADADWVIAGINAGANLGADVYQSGTVAAAREAAVLGYPAMAVSQYIARDQTIDWPVTGRLAQRVIWWLLQRRPATGCYWNANLPHPLTEDAAPALSVCRLDTHPHAFHFRIDGDRYFYQGEIHNRPRSPGRDVAVCFGGQVALTCLGLDSTAPE